jgi:hypothetical protein
MNGGEDIDGKARKNETTRKVIDLAQDMDQWWALVSTVLNRRVP